MVPQKLILPPQHPLDLRALSLRAGEQVRTLPCPQLHGGGWLLPALITSLLALGDSLEDIQLFTVQLLHTLACDLG